MQNQIFDYTARLQDLLATLPLNKYFNIPPAMLQAGIIIIGVFLIALVFGLARHHMLHWSMQGAFFGVVFGIVLTLVVESFLIMNAKPFVVQVINTNTFPPQVRSVLQENIVSLAQTFSSTQTLGAATQVGVGKPSTERVHEYFDQLNDSDKKAVRQLICVP